MKADEIRNRFISYFGRQGHRHLPGSPLIAAEDPDLMFVNAGMVQFKAIFTGDRDPPCSRAATFQKCLRVSGKHNDLEEVGRTTSHHTFFEMLGNFSFGDYFKREAIGFAWEFVTEELGFDPARLWVTVHRDDDDAFELWAGETGVPRRRIRRLGDKDNFWQMGETGPCGPCSELHYDLRGEVDDRIGDDQFEAAGAAGRIVEFWNLVFMQFDRAPGGLDTPLPAPSIDTGAGLERIASLLQGAGSNYHTELFLPIIHAAQERLGVEYSLAEADWNDGVSLRVLADHARAVAFLLADGVFPSNEKRGYVLRRILRRAVRHYWLLGCREPMLQDLVGVVATLMSGAFPELESRREHLVRTTRREEELFLSTIEEGMVEIDRAMPVGGGGALSGEAAFRLKDTYGIPEDMTALIAGERGYVVDWKGFERSLEVQRARSRAGAASRASGKNGAGKGDAARLAANLVVEGEAGGRVPEQVFVGYETLEAKTRVLRWGRASPEVAFVLARNPFYAESGGQVGDTGRISGDDWVVGVTRVWMEGDGCTVVAGTVMEGALPDEPGEVTARVAVRDRREAERNHTATHLLHAVLRERLGGHVQQAGSLVAPDRLRFDFTHAGPLTERERSEVEAEVNALVLANHPVTATQRSYEEATGAGAMALFGEKYGDMVRVVEVPGVSLELCGGTHVRTTGQIGLFKIVSETGVAAGVRRVEAVTGHKAYRQGVERERLLRALSDKLRVGSEDLLARVERLTEERDRLASELQGVRGKAAVRQLEGLLAGAGLGGARFVSGQIEVSAGTDLGELADGLRGAMRTGAAVIHAIFPEKGRHEFISVVSDDLVREGLKAGDLVRVSSRATGSGGGGGPRFARGGVGDPALAREALGAARAWAVERVPALAES